MALLAAFLFGFLSIAGISLVVQRLINDLDRELANERAQLFVAEQVVQSIHEIERLFYKMGSQFGERMRQRTLRDIDDVADRLSRQLDVLQHGGTVRQELALNLFGIDDMVREVTVTPGAGEAANHSSLAVIELAPFIDRIREYALETAGVLDARDACQHRPAQCFRDARVAVELHYKTIPSFFFRLSENANRQFYEGVAHLDRLEAEMRRQQSSLRRIQYGLVVLVVVSVLWLSVFFVRRISDAQRALRRAMEQAESANHAKSSFLATMSHEIRTPMNGILGMAQVLANPALETTQRQECVRVLLESGRHLLAIIDDILDLSKVEAARMELHPVPVRPVVLAREVIAVFSESARAKRQALTFAGELADDTACLADPIRIKQMMSNLVSNAIKFTPAGGSVTVRVDRAEDGWLEFSVTDTGIGIPVDQQPRLFEKFTQLDNSSTRVHSGAGLGLSIVKQLAILMKGQVGVESSSGHGARIWFRLPLPPVRSEQAELPQQAEPPVQLPETASTDAPRLERAAGAPALAGRVLVAEDHPVNRLFLQMILKRSGAQADFVEDGRQAVDASGQQTYGLILMDMRMPVMDGLEATRAIRRREAELGRPRCPIMAVTANAFERDRQACLDAGMDDFLAKPVNARDLNVKLQRWLAPGPGETPRAPPRGAPAAASPAAPDPARDPVTIPAPDPAVIASILERLLPALEQQLFEAVAGFRELESAVRGTCAEERIREIGKRLEKLDFPAVRDALLGWRGDPPRCE